MPFERAGQLEFRNAALRACNLTLKHFRCSYIIIVARRFELLTHGPFPSDASISEKLKQRKHFARRIVVVIPDDRFRPRNFPSGETENLWDVIFRYRDKNAENELTFCRCLGYAMATRRLRSSHILRSGAISFGFLSTRDLGL